MNEVTRAVEANGLTVWRSQDGRRVPMSKMEDRHLRNTIRYLRRNSDYLAIRYLRGTSRMRSNMGEHAQDAFEEGAAAAADGTDHDRCKWMSEEQRLSAVLWTFTDLRVVRTEFVASGEGTYRLTFEDGRTLAFSAVGDDATYCTMEVGRDEA